MQVEARLVQRTRIPSVSSPGASDHTGAQLGGDDSLKSKSARLTAEFRSWARLFDRKLVDRTWIGVLMMVFQRTCG